MLKSVLTGDSSSLRWLPRPSSVDAELKVSSGIERGLVVWPRRLMTLRFFFFLLVFMDVDPRAPTDNPAVQDDVGVSSPPSVDALSVASSDAVQDIPPTQALYKTFGIDGVNRPSVLCEFRRLESRAIFFCEIGSSSFAPVPFSVKQSLTSAVMVLLVGLSDRWCSCSRAA